MSVHVNPELEVNRLLREHRGELIRTKRHLVWKFPDGKMFTQACTPSDVHAHNNQLRDLRRLLGLNGERGTPGERRERSNKPGRTDPVRIVASANPAMLEAMRKRGLVEAALNTKLATAAIELKASRSANHRKKVQLRALNDHCVACWACRWRRWWRRIRSS